ncbi:uncharacterized protein BJ171DRAFT_490253 [Polychytrium aggregatum]|uniref:uncharacterized protein n=1 Tax=Polychytrium aggregatum TaxID=110093 RepID=UPI0022FEC046|nr:uncharacterized protein BJ171DRAFT_490253 [Polychytrium aggregatum]KAI9208107.1 hypothetical protein BJ171DRAFT_490253 [Polychytrium aggregatum]
MALLHRIFNTFAYVLFLWFNLRALLSISDEPEYNNYYGSHATYLTPAPWAFAIWGLIQLLFGGFVIWQWLPGTEEIVRHGFNVWFIVAAAFSSIWFVLWEENYLVLALVVLVLATGAVSIIYFHLANLYPSQSPAQTLFVHAPVSLWHGWLVFVFWLNLLAIFTTVNDPVHPDWIHTLVVLLVIVHLAITSMAYTQYKSQYGDLPGAFAVIWALAAVGAHQAAVSIHYSAFIAVVVVVLYALGQPARARYLASNAETRPLLG